MTAFSGRTTITEVGKLGQSQSHKNKYGGEIFPRTSLTNFIYFLFTASRVNSAPRPDFASPINRAATYNNVSKISHNIVYITAEKVAWHISAIGEVLFT